MERPIILRKTSDDKTVQVWADGDLTGSLGLRFTTVNYCPLPVRDIALSTLIAEEACLFASNEMWALIKAGRELSKAAPVLPGALRARAVRILEKRAKVSEPKIRT